MVVGVSTVTTVWVVSPPNVTGGIVGGFWGPVMVDAGMLEEVDGTF